MTTKAHPDLGAAFLWECFDADFEQGRLRWARRPAHHFTTEDVCAGWNARYAGKDAGSMRSDGYIAVSLSFAGTRFVLLAHRVLWCMRTGQWPESSVDHRDLARANNASANLRLATASQQNANRGPIRPGLKGASFDKQTGRFMGQINSAGRNIFLGRFVTEEEAHRAYVEAARRLHGEFAKW